MKNLLIIALAALIGLGRSFAQTGNKKTENFKEMRTADQYTFILSDKVTRQKVNFKNRYGILLTGDLYVPKKNGPEPLAALAISGPFGAVKEQSSGLYANQMAERGFITLAFDPSYTGESGGEPRNVASPDINTEDFSAAVDFLGLQKSVDRNRIGIIGICGWAGFSLNAAAVDKRIKAVATTSMYDMSRLNAKGYDDKMTAEERTNTLEQISEQRWKDAEQDAPAPSTNNLPEKLQGDEPQFVKEYFDYYKTPRGFHPRSINSNGAWTATNALSFMNMPLLTYIKEIAPRPVLLIAGEKAHSRYFSEDAYKAATGQKELMIIPNAVHVDLYDRLDVIPFDKLTSFFKQHLNRGTGNKIDKVKENSPATVTIETGSNKEGSPLAAIFPKGELGPPENFTGKAWNTGLVANDAIYNTVVGNVYFEPGARSNWHIHPAGQILVITDGVGYHQIKGQPRQTIRKGDVVKCPPNVEHWHGASSDTGLQQMYIITNIEKGIVKWLRPVTEAEYN